MCPLRLGAAILRRPPHIDNSDEFAYENTSFDYEFAPQPHDGYPKSFESNEVL